jgi:hypothetical protein
MRIDLDTNWVPAMYSSMAGQSLALGAVTMT